MTERGFWRLILLSIIAVFLTGINPARAEETTILALGDSLTAGLGLRLEDAFPAQLEARLREKGHNARVINSGVSGETSSGARARLEWTLLQNPDAVILATGGNDMLRALDPSVTRDNIGAMLKILKDRKIPVLLAGMKGFSGLGKNYTQKYEAVFTELAAAHGVLFYPFFLEGVALHPDLMQPDGLHPNPDGVRKIAEGILPSVEKLIAAAEKIKPAAPR